MASLCLPSGATHYEPNGAESGALLQKLQQKYISDGSTRRKGTAEESTEHRVHCTCCRPSSGDLCLRGAQLLRQRAVFSAVSALTANVTIR